MEYVGYSSFWATLFSMCQLM